MCPESSHITITARDFGRRIDLDRDTGQMLVQTNPGGKKLETLYHL